MDYSTSSGSKVNPRSRIVVKLDRLLLDELELDSLLNAYSCLILDEAHERTLSIDVILGLVSNILKNRKDFKVVVTSATLNAELFEHYFSSKTFMAQAFYRCREFVPNGSSVTTSSKLQNLLSSR